MAEINKKVIFKSAGKKTVYSLANSSSTTSIINVPSVTTIYTAIKEVGNFYYIIPTNKWVYKNQVTDVTGTSVASGGEVKYRFTNLAKMVYTYSSQTSTKETGSFWPEDRLYTVTKIKNNRAYISEIGAWVNASLLEAAVYTYTEEETTKEKVESVISSNYYNNAISDFENTLVDSDSSLSSTGNSNANETYEINNMAGVWGLPYQFAENVDPKLSDTTFGQYYADRTISRMPLLLLSPGKVSFMKNNDTSLTETVQDLFSLSDQDSTLNAYLTSSGKYYTFEYDTVTYWQYVNTMNMACAIYLGIGDVKITYNGHTAKIKDYLWEHATNAKFQNWVQGSDTFITFFCDSESTAGEDFSNTTQESMIASTLNKSSDLGKEIRFLIGENGALTDILNADTISTALETIDGLTNRMLGEGNIVSQLGREFAIIASGGRLIFPEIWGDSTFSTDFDVKIKLRCPCPNKVAWFFDIVVPLNCLKALTMPRTPHGSDIAGQLLTSDMTSNGYFSPFLVRGFYKGLSTVDMGIVTGLRIDKGKEGSWTIDGLPTEVDVSLTIKDLYNTMAMSTKENDNASQLLNNTQFLSYLAFNCGISINQPDIVKSSMLWGMIYATSIFQNLKNSVTLYNYWRALKQGVSNNLTDWLSWFR